MSASKHETKGTPDIQYTIFAIVGFVFYIFSRLWMYLRYGQYAFGYDTGIYRHFIFGYFERFGDPALQPFGFSAISNTLLYLGSHADEIMYTGYIFLSFVLCGAVYIVAKNYFDRRVACVAVFLFAVSFVQFEFYTWYYYRNFLALFFILMSFFALKKSSHTLFLFLFALGIIHPLSLIPLGMTLCVQFLFDKNRRKYLFFHGAIAALLLLVLNWREFAVYLPFFTEQHGMASNAPAWQQSEATGQFVDLRFFLYATLFYVPFAILGLVSYVRKQKTLFIFLCANVALIVFGIVFYRRFYAFVDIVLILFASGGLVRLLSMLKEHVFVRWLFIILFLSIPIFFGGKYVVEKQPLITESEFVMIQNLDTLIPEESYLMVIDSHYAPWVYGFTNHKIIAPGMFEYNVWGHEAWQEFWYTQDQTRRHALLEQYDQVESVYVFLGEYGRDFEEVLVRDSRFTYIDIYTWRFDL